ncbi:MAG: hypothetical protein WDM96_13090 [Lacunisphaera sp.]
MTVSGATSSWTNSGNILVGDAGSGTLTISNGGTVTSSGLSIIGKSATGSGSASVDGIGSSWINDGDLYVGNGRTGFSPHHQRRLGGGGHHVGRFAGRSNDFPGRRHRQSLCQQRRTLRRRYWRLHADHRQWRLGHKCHRLGRREQCVADRLRHGPGRRRRQRLDKLRHLDRRRFWHRHRHPREQWCRQPRRRQRHSLPGLRQRRSRHLEHRCGRHGARGGARYL